MRKRPQQRKREAPMLETVPYGSASAVPRMETAVSNSGANENSFSSSSSLIETPIPPPPLLSSLTAPPCTQATQECTEDQRTQPCTQAFTESSQLEEWGNLICLSDNRVFPLIKTEVTLGRGASCDLAIPLQKISEKHCIIERNSVRNGVVLRDNKSTNGTFVNGKMVRKGESITLNSGDQISLLPAYLNSLEAAFYFYLTNSDEGSGFSNFYIFSNVILGSGTSSEVKECTERRTGTKCAVKIVKKHRFAGCKKALDCIQSEVKILSKLNHPNIVRYIDIFEDDKKLFIVLELVSGGDLLNRLDRDSVIPEKISKNIFKQLLEGVKYLHQNSITHRDLKPANILLAGKYESPIPKISDFGVAHNLLESEAMTTYCGTPQYAAPEILLRGFPNPSVDSAPYYGKEVDMWSLGVILYMMLSGTPPFSDEGRKASMFDQITKCQYDFSSKEWSNISEHAMDLIKKLLIADPASRLTASDALNHVWFGSKELPIPVPAIPISPEEKKSKLLSLRRVAGMSPSALHHIPRLSDQQKQQQQQQNNGLSSPTVTIATDVTGTPEKIPRTPQKSNEVLAPDSDEESPKRRLSPRSNNAILNTPKRLRLSPLKRKIAVSPEKETKVTSTSSWHKPPKFSALITTPSPTRPMSNASIISPAPPISSPPPHVRYGEFAKRRL